FQKIVYMLPLEIVDGEGGFKKIVDGGMVELQKNRRRGGENFKKSYICCLQKSSTGGWKFRKSCLYATAKELKPHILPPSDLAAQGMGPGLSPPRSGVVLPSRFFMTEVLIYKASDSNYFFLLVYLRIIKI